MVLFPLYINDLPVVTCIIAICADVTTLYSTLSDEASDLWQQLELSSEIESDL